MPKQLILFPLPLSTEQLEGQVAEQEKELLRQTTVFFVENVRTSRRFISALNLGIDISSLRFEVLDKKTSLKTVQELFLRYKEEVIGIMSEAGTPCTADPGHVAVAEAHRQNIPVLPLMGANSIILSLMSSGMNGQQFTFHGYLPINQKDRKIEIQKIESEAIRTGYTQLFIETPYRNMQMLDSLLTVCQNNTLLSISAGLFSSQQLIKTLAIQNWKREKLDIHKVPAVFLLSRP